MEKWTKWWGAAVLVLGVGAVFGRVTGFPFLEWDDRANFAENPYLSTEGLGGVGAFWSGAFGHLYVPVTYTVWAVLAWAGGMLGADGLEVGEPGTAPALFHGANAVLHAGSAVMVFLILRMVQGSGFRVQGWGRGRGEGRGESSRSGTLRARTVPVRLQESSCWPALIGAGVFALHPVQVEAVAWATGMKDVLAGFLGLAAMALYLEPRKTRKRGSEPQRAQRRAEGRRGEGGEGRSVEGRGSRGEGGGVSSVEGGGAKAVAALPHSEGSLRDRGSLAAVCSWLLFVLALLAKPGAVAVPVMLLALETVALGVSWKRSAARLWPWFAAAAGAVLVTAGVQGESVAMAMPEGTPLWFRPFVFLDALGFYLGKVIAPVGLGMDYGRSPGWLLESGTWKVSWVVGAAVTVGAVLGWRFPVRGWGRKETTNGHEGARMGEGDERRRRSNTVGIDAAADRAHGLEAHATGRVLAAAWFVFVAGVLPVSGLVAFAFQRNSTVADRYLYLPMLGVGMAVCAVCAVLGSRLAVRGWGRKETTNGHEGARMGEGVGIAQDVANAKGADGIEGETKAVAELPHREARYLPGLPGRQSEGALRDRGIVDSGAMGVRIASVVFVVVLGVLSSFQLEHWRDSRALVVRALEVNPASAEMNYARGSQFFETGDVEVAVAYYRKALEGDARHWRAHHQLADALGEKGDWRRALAHLEEANAIMPGHPVVLGDLGFALAATGKRREAEATYRAVLEVAPGDLRARHDLGVLLLERGVFGEAVAELRAVWEEAPDETTAFNFRKALVRYAAELEQRGKAEEAAAVRGEAGRVLGFEF